MEKLKYQQPRLRSDKLSHLSCLNGPSTAVNNCSPGSSAASSLMDMGVCQDGNSTDGVLTGSCDTGTHVSYSDACVSGNGVKGDPRGNFCFSGLNPSGFMGGNCYAGNAASQSGTSCDTGGDPSPFAVLKIMSANIDRIIELRKDRQISIKRFAELLDVTTKTIYNWENKVSQPRKSDLMAIAYLFNINLNDISEHKNPGFHYTKPGLQKSNNLKASTKLLKEIIEEDHFGDSSRLLPLLKAEETIENLTSENCRLNEKVSELSKYLNIIDTAIYIKNSNRIITYINNAFLKLFPEEIKEYDILGHKFSELFPNNQCLNIIKLENEAFKGGYVNNIPITFPIKSKQIKCRISIKPISTTNNQIQQIITAIIV